MAESARFIDLNCDCGESFGAWTMGDDAAVLRHVSSANIACGFHGGDPQVMWRTVALCVRLGVAIGAHPGHRDLAGFGRRALPVSASELHAETLYQLGALGAICSAQGARLRHVKPHGALYHQVDREPALAAAFVAAVRATDPRLRVVGPPLGALMRAAQDAGLRFSAEGFVERGYGDDGRLLARGLAGAELDDPQLALRQALDLIERAGVRSVSGAWLTLAVQTLCMHGDRTDAVLFADTVRRGLDAAGVLIRAPVAD